MMDSSQLHSNEAHHFDLGQLVTLLRHRPDLTVPRPINLSDLMRRAHEPVSSLHAIKQLDSWMLFILEGLAAWEKSGRPFQISPFATALGIPDRHDDIEKAIKQLETLALISVNPVHLTKGAAETFGDYPGGLAPQSSSELSEKEIREALETVDAGSKSVLNRLLWENPVGIAHHADRSVAPDNASTPIEQLLAHGLLRPFDSGHVVLPREVSLYLRDGRLLHKDAPPTEAPGWSSFAPDSASKTALSLDPDLLDRAAIGSAQEFTSHFVIALDYLAAHTPRALANGNVSKRDLTLLSKITGNEDLPRFIIELAKSCGLIAQRGQLLMPTPRFDQFLELDSFSRWKFLHNAWKLLDWWPTDETSKGRSFRTAVASELASPASRTAVTPFSLSQRLRWRHPSWPITDWPAAAKILHSETTWLGLLSFSLTNVLTTQEASSADPGFSAFGDTLMLQSDLTAIAPAPLNHDASLIMSIIADQESHGATATYRFTQKSILRAMNAGWSASDISRWLMAHNHVGNDVSLPASLETLLADIARHHGQVRVMTASTIVQLDDEADIAALLADPRTTELGLTALSSNILVSDSEPSEIVMLLRTHGLDPVAQNTSGTRFTTPEQPRAHAPRLNTSTKPIDIEALATDLLNSPVTYISPEQTIKTLKKAQLADAWVTVEWVDSTGSLQNQRMYIVSVTPGTVDFSCANNTQLTLPLTHIVTVTF